MKYINAVLLGSFLALAGCGDQQQASTDEQAPTLMDQARDSAGAAADRAEQLAQDTRDAAGQAVDSAQDTAADAMAEVDETATQATDAAQDSAADAMAQVEGAADAAADSAGGMAAAAQDEAGEAMASAEQMADDAAQTMGVAPATAPAQEQASVADAPAAATDAESAAQIAPAAGASSADLAQGQAVYDSKCKACHATGAAGAPKLDDKANWAPRLEQGMDVMVQHAIEGFKGDTGYMPPKGGFMSLTDEEVRNAVAYMVDKSQ